MSTIAIFLLASLSYIVLWRSIALIARNRKSRSMVEWPVVGMLPGLLWNASIDLHGFVTQLMKENGGTFVFKGPWFAKLDFIITTDPMNMQHVFGKNHANYEKGEDMKAILDVLGEEGISLTEGESWKFQRQMTLLFLYKNEFERYMLRAVRQNMEDVLFRVLDGYCSSRLDVEVDIQDVVKRFMFDTSCLWIVGVDPGCLSVNGPSNTFTCGKAFEEIEEALLYRHLVPRVVWEVQKRLQIGSEKKMRICTKVVDDFLYNIIKTRKQELQSNQEQPKKLDFLTQWMVADETKDSSDKNLRDNVVASLAAGRGSLSSALIWLLWLVATHPDVERKLLEEIERVVLVHAQGRTTGGGGGQRSSSGFLMSKGELNTLVYLHATICEALRLHSPLPFEHRCAREADVLPSGHVVTKGSRMLFSIYSMGSMEDIWGEDCTEFKPERWISEQGSIINVPTYKFMTFLAGPRTCVGKALSFMQLKFITTALLWNYKFDMVEGHVVRPVASLGLVMKDGLKMRVSKRHIN